MPAMLQRNNSSGIDMDHGFVANLIKRESAHEAKTVYQDGRRLGLPLAGVKLGCVVSRVKECVCVGKQPLRSSFYQSKTEVIMHVNALLQ